MKHWSMFIQHQDRHLNVVNTVTESFSNCVLNSQDNYVRTFVAALLPKALRYWIPRDEIATETWFQQPGMLC